MSTRADGHEQRKIQDSNASTVATTTDDHAVTCVICCEPISDSSETWPCNHRHFDYLCIATWLFKDSRCPVCRTPVSSLIRDSTKETLSNFGDAKPALRVSPPTRQAASPAESWRRRAAPSAFRRPRARPEAPWGGSSVRPRDSFDRALSRRRAVYAHSRFSKHVGTNRVSRYRELTPRLFCQDEELVSRARMWIRRELQVFPFLSAESPQSLEDHTTGQGSPSSSRSAAPIPSERDANSRRRAQNAEFLLEYIIAILKSVDIMGSAGEAENMISEFLGRDNTQLFLHELRAWLRSPFTKLEDWDRAVQYDDEGQRTADSSAGRRWHPRREASGRRSSPRPPHQTSNALPSHWRRSRDRRERGGRPPRFEISE